MFLGTVSVCLTVLVLNIHHRDSERPLPNWLRVLCFQYLARILCVVGRKPKSLAELERRVEDENHPKRNQSVRSGLQRVASVYFKPLFHGSTNFQNQVQSNDTSPSNDNHSNNRDDFSYPLLEAANGNGCHSRANHNGNTANGTATRNGITFKRKKTWHHNNAYEWKEVAHILDKLFFIIVFICMSTSLLLFILVPYYKEPFSHAKVIDPNS